MLPSSRRVWWIVLLCAATAFAQENTNRPYVDIYAPYFAKVGEPFEITVSLSPESKETVIVQMERTAAVTYVPSKFEIRTGQGEHVSCTIRRSGTGVVWIRASARGHQYHDGYNPVVADFEGHLKMMSAPTLSYESPTTVTLAILDSNNKPIRLDTDLELVVESTDGILSRPDGAGKILKLGLPPGAITSPDFQVKPTSIQGGSVHLNAALSLSEFHTVLTQEEFTLNADPAWWLPVLLAIGGGLINGLYKVSRLPSSGNATKLANRMYTVVGVLVASGVGGLVGYLFARLDLLGLKLDPNVLRSYPLIGFLFSYIGFEVLLPERLGGSRKKDDMRTEKEI
jgi:hypothetical protein